MKKSEGFGDITDKKGNKYFYGPGKFAGKMIKPAPKKKTDPGVSRARATNNSIKHK